MRLKEKKKNKYVNRKETHHDIRHSENQDARHDHHEHHRVLQHAEGVERLVFDEELRFLARPEEDGVWELDGRRRVVGCALDVGSDVWEALC